MAERHIMYTTSHDGATLSDVMYAIYQFVADSDLFQFVDDSGTPSVYNGSAYATPSVYTFFGNGSYMVIEPVGDEPWQVKIRLDTSGADLFLEWAPNGGWASASFGANLTSGSIAWNDSNQAPNGTQVYLSESDLDGYGFLRCLMFDTADFHEGFYVGGYKPIDATNNTEPFVCLTGNPESNASAAAWGRDSPTTTGRVGNAYGTPTTLIPAHIYSADHDGMGVDENGMAIITPVYLATVSNLTLGLFGHYTMMAIDGNKADRDTDTATTYMVVNNLAMRWNP